MKQFVERLVNISHSQWLYRNFTLHHYAKGYLRQWAEKEIIEEVKRLADTRPSEIPLECNYLLELPQRPQQSSSAAYKAYWVLARRAAKSNLQNDETRWARLGTQKRCKLKMAPGNLLKGVQELLYNHLLHRTRGTKRDIQELAPPNLICKQGGRNRRRQPNIITISNSPSAKRA